MTFPLPRCYPCVFVCVCVMSYSPQLRSRYLDNIETNLRNIFYGQTVTNRVVLYPEHWCRSESLDGFCREDLETIQKCSQTELCQRVGERELDSKVLLVIFSPQ